MQLRLDAADRLVELVEERRGPVPAEEAARSLFALRGVPTGLARGLLDPTVLADSRLAWRGDAVGLTDPPGAGLHLERATFVVVDLETTGLRPGACGICEIGAVRVRALEREASFQTLVDPGRPIGQLVTALTGIRETDVRGAPSPLLAVEGFLRFAGDAVLVAHNARFDLAFLDRETELITGRRIAAPVVDTVGLARRLLAGRSPRFSLGALAYFFGTANRPCHRALPDAEATAEVLLALIGLAQERGAQTVAELCELAATRVRRVHAKRSLAFGAPRHPGVYLFRDAHDQVLYVGRARDLRARLRSYFGSERQRPAVEAALAALERIEWRVCGSELEAALEELRLLRELRPPANKRSLRPDRYSYLRRRGEGWVCSTRASPLGPIKSRSRARLAARALDSAGVDEIAKALPALREKLARLARELRFEDAARLRDRIEALEHVQAELDRIERLRRLELCLLVPDLRDGWRRAYAVSNGRIVAARSVPPGAGARIEVEALLRAAAVAELSWEPEAADELLLLGTFLRRPPPELEVVPLAELRRSAAGSHAQPHLPGGSEPRADERATAFLDSRFPAHGWGTTAA
jgi:DNA polymerase-3 subunit epsilon